MILVDHRVGSIELAPYIRNLGVPVVIAGGHNSPVDQLESGDVCFEGKGPQGNITIGIERKRISDILNCIDDGRYAGFQQPGMMEDYHKRILIIEGVWKPTAEGYLLEFQNGVWRHPTGRPILYDKLFSFLLSVWEIAGTPYLRSGTIAETAYNIVCIFKWFSKDWDNHTSQLQTQNIVLPQFTKPSFERKFACLIDGIGIKRSIEAEKHFKTVPNMVKADEQAWMSIDGLGVKTARKIVRQIWGIK